jgi:hypothetical protein
MELVFEADGKTMEGSNWFAMLVIILIKASSTCKSFLEEDLVKTIVLGEELVSGLSLPKANLQPYAGQCYNLMSNRSRFTEGRGHFPARQ